MEMMTDSCVPILTGARTAPMIARGLFVLMLVLMMGATTLAQELSEGELVFMAKVKEGEYKKIGTLLGFAVEETEAGATADASATLSVLQYNDQGKVLVDVTLISSDAIQILSSARIQGQLGFETTACVEHLCSGAVPLENLTSFAASEEVLCIQPVMAKTHTGSVTSEGDRAMFADIARARLGVTGKDILVGVLSDSYDCCGNSVACRLANGLETNAAADIASGDLPKFNKILKDLKQCEMDNPDEGRAMMQVIYDVAPGTKLAFHTAFLGKAVFAKGIVALADAGCKVIVDDVGVAFTTYFQDDVIAQAVDKVVARGIPYFSAAGNQGRQAWHNGFVDSGVAGPGNGRFHDFNPGAGVDTTQTLQVTIMDTYAIEFQWDEPSASIPGSVGSTSDLDIYIVDPTNNAIITFSVNDNIGMAPIERVVFRPTIGTIGIRIVLKSGPPPRYMKWQVDSGDLPVPSNIEYPVLSSTTYGHSNAAGAAAVGAASYLQTPAFGIDPPVQEDFSSAGGTPIFFSVSGTRLTVPEVRQQPRFVGPDRGITTFFGDANNRFFGTSCAAPHVAAVAALMLELNPGLTPNDIYTRLQATAIDMDDTATVGVVDVGFDSGTGFGFVNANAALPATPTPPTPPRSPILTTLEWLWNWLIHAT